MLFKDGAEKLQQVLPFSALDSTEPEKLWGYLASYQAETGGDVIAIPHNGNLSLGHMFMTEDSQGNTLTSHYAKMRARWEPLFEVTQQKGDSESHPSLSPSDEFADFETWGDYITGVKDLGRRHEYARSALKLGLSEQAMMGVNPFKFGLMGSTDTHNNLPGVQEKGVDDYLSALSTPETASYMVTTKSNYPAAGGYAAVWATENTRESLFAAMRRKEVYATTGPRMTVRFFGGWDYEGSDVFRPDLAKIGYQKGVPMGGSITQAPKGKSASFLIHAVKDPDGANLDRVQVVKGWQDARGQLHEKIYNVALSDNRSEDKKGKVVPVGNTVDIKNASYTNSIGDMKLTTVWVDPNFDKSEAAFYYLRVLEIPTPRWTAYYAKDLQINDIAPEYPMVTQERAYSSPIWYNP